MDRLRAMRQRDWARVFGFGCAAVAVGLSVADYAGAQWDALILCLGGLMLLRSAVDRPAIGRAGQVLRALRLILFMFAFAAVNRAQGGVEGAVGAALGNRVLWGVAALLLALPLFRKPTATEGQATMPQIALLLAAGAGFWLLFRWIDGAGDMAQLRALVATAATITAVPIWQAKGQPWVAGVAFALMAVCVAVTPGASLWPVALGTVPFALALVWLRRRDDFSAKNL